MYMLNAARDQAFVRATRCGSCVFVYVRMLLIQYYKHIAAGKPDPVGGSGTTRARLTPYGNDDDDVGDDTHPVSFWHSYTAPSIGAFVVWLSISHMFTSFLSSYDCVRARTTLIH